MPRLQASRAEKQGFQAHAVRQEALRKLRTVDLERFWKAMRTNPSVLRTRYVLALLADRDRKQAERLRQDFERQAARYPYPGEVEGERELLELADAKATTMPPD